MRKYLYLISLLLLFSCEKEDTHDDCSCDSHDATQMRMAMQEDGYIEIEERNFTPCCYVKQPCNWNK